ncbi:MAG TPA: SDR family NAD(P)-dependent oxidoreductase [Xanthobacteraceae bacterium]|nr:SDR family NAD(P)-dependent oxidoreductase [Xanthobacteraceae bacterium]
MDYRDRHVVVTGGTGALGTAMVGALLEAGAVCHVPYLDQAKADRFAFCNHPKVKLLADIELREETAVAKLYASVSRLWASIHIAGGFAMAPITETTRADLMKQIDVNLVTAFLCCRASISSMLRVGAGGRIVNVATRPALEWRAGSGMVAYTASKTAVAALTVALAEEVVRAGILVNAVAPSTMDTPANRQAMPDADHASWAKVEEVAATILFLASPENRVTRGAVVPVYGRS